MADGNPQEKLDLSGLFRPTAEAQGLPGLCYLDEGYYRLEQQRLFAHFFMRSVARHLGYAAPPAAPGFSGTEERTAPVRYSA